MTLDIVDIVSALATVIALVVALVQIVKAQRDLVAERRRIFELEVLRDLADALDDHGLRQTFPYGGQLTTRLALLASDDLPSWHVVDATGQMEALTALNARHVIAPDDSGFERAAEIVRETLRGELVAAISRRAPARRSPRA